MSDTKSQDIVLNNLVAILVTEIASYGYINALNYTLPGTYNKCTERTRKLVSTVYQVSEPVFGQHRETVIKWILKHVDESLREKLIVTPTTLHSGPSRLQKRYLWILTVPSI
jgi:hypothetical protein